jgi:hypothetical protein
MVALIVSHLYLFCIGKGKKHGSRYTAVRQVRLTTKH